MCCKVSLHVHFPNLSWNMFPAGRNSPDRRPEVQERCHLYRGLSSSGPPEEGWGHTTGGDKHTWGVHVAGDQQSHARHHQQPVQHWEDSGRKLRWVSKQQAADSTAKLAELSLLRMAAEKVFVCGNNARICQMIKITMAPLVLRMEAASPCPSLLAAIKKFVIAWVKNASLCIYVPVGVLSTFC